MQQEVVQESLKEPLDTPRLPLEYAHGVGEVDPLLNVGPHMSFESEDYCAIVCEEKHVLHNNDDVPATPIPFETVVSESTLTRRM